jgi:glutamate-ammonia-ligase adenylyltransferase
MFLRYLVDDPRTLGVLVEVLGTSPFLSEILIRNPEYLHWVVGQIDRSPPGAIDLVEEVESLIERAAVDDALADALKRFRRREVLRIAARDLLGVETLESATAQISDLADVVTGQALRLAERKVLAAAGRERLPGTFAVLGMGKLGGSELNYSSDIDLIFVYEPDDEQEQAQHELFHKLSRTLLAVMTDFTDEGSLYRVDLRLRPMGRRGNIAYSLRQHLQYYDDWGETFERFALIKARPIAGDLDLGRRFVALVQPFVYRKYLDHVALEEIFRHKARAEKAHEDADRDVKIGRGGIREIELFTQALLLTYGAGQPALREANTLAALRALVDAGLIAEELRDDLARAYTFLRTVEHRLQIVQEQQTHALARGRQELETSARRLGFSDADALEAEVARTRTRVRAIYNLLFERRAGTFDFESRQFFRILTEEVGGEEALEFLAGYPLRDAAGALEIVRALDQATALAPSRSMTRNVLSNLLPAIMDRLGGCARPDQALLRLEQVAVGTGAAASFFRTLLENEALRNLLVSTLDLGDLPATRLTRYPEILDSLLFTLQNLDDLGARYRAALADVEPERRFSRIRRFKAIEEFKILVESVSDGSLTLLQQRLSLLADTCVAQAAAWSVPEGLGDQEWAVVALGKLGGAELTVHSDLDLVVVYRGDPADAERFGAWQRFVQDMMRCFEEPTEDGIVYRVDTRLRPEGRTGALAMPIATFRQYLDTRADIWERLAWTRGRVVTGADALAGELADAVRAFVYGPWDPRIPQYMTDVRGRMVRELGDPSGRQLEFKIGRGGLADIDFLLQMIQIREGHAQPAFRIPGTRGLLERLPETKFLTGAEADELRRAHGFLRSLETFARMEMDTNVSAVPIDGERLVVLGRRLGFPEPAGDVLRETYQRETERVRSVYEMVIARL